MKLNARFVGAKGSLRLLQTRYPVQSRSDDHQSDRREGDRHPTQTSRLEISRLVRALLLQGRSFDIRPAILLCLMGCPLFDRPWLRGDGLDVAFASSFGDRRLTEQRAEVPDESLRLRC